MPESAANARSASRARQSGSAAGEPAAPELPYRPIEPRQYRPRIGLIGCGGITEVHLKAYRQAGYDVALLCDAELARARKRRDDFYPNASVCRDYREMLRRPDIDVVDVATHPAARAELLVAAIDAGKHVLSQKPLTLDLDFGQRLVEQAHDQGVKLAVNQNGRWAPHWRYASLAVEAGHLGAVQATDLAVHWDHTWVAGTPFDRIHHLILYDYAIHWFDILGCLMPGAPQTVFAQLTHAPNQPATPPLLAQAVVAYEQAQASLIFRAGTPYGPRDRTMIVGDSGTIESIGPSENEQSLALTTAAGTARPGLVGKWFPDGFHGAMAELLRAIEEDRGPTNSAADNLKSLALCFAAVRSAETGEPVAPGSVRRLEAA